MGAYTGPTLFEGEQIKQDHSPNVFVRSVLNYIKHSGYASINIVGIPGSGKTTMVTMLLHLLHIQKPEYRVIWAGANELRNLKSFLSNLPKCQSYAIAFEDASAALESLSTADQAEVFETMTQARHITEGKVLFITIYHYSFASLKRMRAQSLFTIFLSASIDEAGNILALIEKDPKAKKRLKFFQRLYHSEYANDYFEIRFGQNTPPHRYITDKPFRIAYCINLSKTHLMVYKKMGCGLCSAKVLEKTIDIDELYRKGHEEKKFGHYWNTALAMMCYNSGNKMALPNKLIYALDFAMKLKAEFYFDIPKLVEKLRKERKLDSKRLYRPKAMEQKLFAELNASAIVTEKPPEPDTEFEEPDDLAEFDGEPEAKIE